jgi:predicted metal-dependent phosphoesterase TrpH
MITDLKIFASCHNHSTFSDADYTPEKLVEIAHSLGHGGIILTDHDTVKGCYFVDKEARKRGMKSLLGCEFTSYHNGVGVHLLGFDFNPDNKEIKAILDHGSSIQRERSELMFKWGQERGTLRLGMSWQDVIDDNPYNDYICNNQVFHSFVKRGIYEPHEYEEMRLSNFSYKLKLEDKITEIIGKSYKDITTEEVVRAILNAGGVPIVAHPHGLMKYTDDFLKMGVLGFETRFQEVTDKEFDFFEATCEEKNLYKMGGSDHSGPLSGLLQFGKEYECPEEKSGIAEEDFMKIYERKLG